MEAALLLSCDFLFIYLLDVRSVQTKIQFKVAFAQMELTDTEVTL